MPNKKRRERNDLSLFDAMTDEELEEFLRLDEHTTQGSESHSEEIYYIMGVLAERNQNRFSAGKTAEEAFISFQENYMPHEDSELSTGPLAEAAVPNRKSRRWLRSLSAAAAAIAVVVVCSVTACALGFDIWGSIVKWTQETFHLGSGSDVDVCSQADSGTTLQDILADYNITEPLVPTWFPEGYELVDVIVDETPFRLSILGIYQNGDQVIKVQIIDYLNGDPQQIEKSDFLIETYESGGIPYYIVSDNRLLQAVWIDDSYECYISGQLTTEELKMMINSI